MLPVGDNPFAILSAVAGPAILTNACSVLALATANRIARVVDRSRVVMSLKKEKNRSAKERRVDEGQLKKLSRRGDLLLRALRLFYAALGMFATTAMIAIFGAAFAAYELRLAFQITAGLGFLVGSLGVIGTVWACTLMVHETRLAVLSVTEEHAFATEQPAPENDVAT